MSQITIKWKPIAVEGEPLHVGMPDLFIMQLQRAFPGEWPIKLTAKNIERLQGMAATTAIKGNPYIDLIEHLERYNKGIELWPEYGEDHGI